MNAAGILQAIDDAMADQRIDHREAAVILQEIEFARRTLATLKLRIESAGKSVVTVDDPAVDS